MPRKLDDDGLKKLFIDLFSRLKDPATTVRERIWFRNILYYIGEQWFDFVLRTGSFKRINPSQWQPTPVSNLVRDHVRSMKALILNKDFTVKVWANSNDQDDKEAAQVGEFLLRHMDAEDDEEFLDETEKVAVWMLLTGLGYMRTFPVIGNSDAWALDANGAPTGSKSKVMSTALSSFNVFVPAMGDSLQQKPHVGIKSLMDREWVEDTFNVKVSSGDSEEEVINYEKILMKLVAEVSPWKGGGIEGMHAYIDQEVKNLVIMKEIEFQPTKDMPEGRYTGSVNGQKIFDYDRLPIPLDQKSESTKWYYTTTDYHYHYVPGRFYADSGVDDIISPQNTVNQIDQDLAKNRKSLGRPIVLLTSDTNIKRVTKYGQSMLVLKWDAFSSAGAKPEIAHGTPLPNQVIDERTLHREAMQDVAGDPKNVLKGSAPQSGASGVMVDILRDAAEQGHFPDILRFYRSHKRTYRKRLILANELFTDERIIKVTGKGHGVEIRTFRSADLRGNTDVRLELSSGIASTRVGQTQMMLQLTEAGFFNADSPLEPEFRDELLQRMGISGFVDRKNTDVERARSENQMIAATDKKGMTDSEVDEGEGRTIKIPVIEKIYITMANPVEGEDPIVLSDDPMFKYDDHSVHYSIHRNFILSPEFRNMEDFAQEILMAHTDEHKAMMELVMLGAQDLEIQTQEKLAQAQARGAAAGAPEGGAPAGPQPPPGGPGVGEVVAESNAGLPLQEGSTV